eukprot:Skav204544  [mRNA]  locus=scaffold3346:64210:66187:- [translate_table: standard]
MEKLRIFHFAIALVIVAAHRDDTTALLQSSRQLKHIGSDSTSTWSSPRDVAILRDPQQVTWSDGQHVKFFSAVPSFGDDGNFIALLMTEDSGIALPHERPMFCSGANRSHLTQLRVKRRNLLCDWPAEEANQDSFEVFLEDDQGNSLGKVIAEAKAGMVQGKYRTVACVRDVYDRRLLQWLEFNVQHGIEHFFVYTFRGTESAVQDVLMPYLKAGLATRIHSDVDPTWEPNPVGFHFDQVIRDCLYRAKSHATWVIPSFDNDEYFRVVSGRMFTNHVVPKDYMNTFWDAIRISQGKRLDQVRSISFRKIRMTAPRSNEVLQISSPWREDNVQFMMGHPGHEVLTKYAYNAHVTYDLWWHWVWEPEPGTEDLKLDKSVAFVQHYRLPWGTSSANVEDHALANHSDMVREAIEARFNEKLEPLLRRLIQKRPNGK